MMNKKLSLPLVALFGAACGVAEAPATDTTTPSTESSDSALLGALNFASDCTATDRDFLGKVTHYGRTVAVSDAFSQCMSNAMRFGQATSWGQIGPYGRCSGDSFYDSTIDEQVRRVVDFARNSDDVGMHCTGGGGIASAGGGTYGHSTEEAFSWSDWLHNVESSLSLPVCADQAARDRGGCRWAADPWPYSQAAGVVWHEASHTHGYGHGDNSNNDAARVACGIPSWNTTWHFQHNTIPYMVGQCISEVIDRSAARCGAPLECGNGGLKIVDSIDGATCSCRQDPQQPGVSWTRVGQPNAAMSIAACQDGRIYALNYDHTLWVNTSGGADTGWRYVNYPWAAQSITCANNKVHALNTDRSFWRNDGTDAAFRWVWVANLTATRQVAGATALAYIFPYSVMYAINDDASLWKSSDGASWTPVGRAVGASRIAAGGGLLEARVFALNYDYTFWLNSGDGCDKYWRYVDYPWATREITAATFNTVYALNSDHTLWRGTITNGQWLTSLAFGRPRHCDGTNLVE